MTASIINLRRARKAAARNGRAADAVAARARHGRTKGERAAEALETARSERVLDGARLEPGEATPPDGR